MVLTVSGGQNYLWNTNENSRSITVGPSQTTTYSVTVIDGNNCEGSDEVEVMVNALPTENAGIGQEICAGDEAILTATGGGDYLWDNGMTTTSYYYRSYINSILFSYCNKCRKLYRRCYS